MAGKKISQLPVLTNAELTTGDFFPVVQTLLGATKKITFGQIDLRYAAKSSFDTLSGTVTTLGSNLTTLTGRVDTAEDDIEAAEADIADHETRLAAAEASIASLLVLITQVTPCGAVIAYVGSTAPTGFVLASNKTIGSATSGATNRANADTFNLYEKLWNAWGNTELTIQDSSGSNTTRGASAAADFAADKRLPVVDTRGRVLAGLDNLGGDAASRLTGTVLSAANTIGAVGGAQTVTLDTTQIPAHTHGSAFKLDGNVLQSTNSAYDLPCQSGSAGNDWVSTSTGGGLAHSNTQPTIVLPFIIRL